MKLEKPLKLNFDTPDIDIRGATEKADSLQEKIREIEILKKENTAIKKDYEESLNATSKDIKNYFDKKLLNACKQIESSMGLQQYLSGGDLPLNYHGCSISPDAAIFLSEKIETENYDLIIEFGGGVSTCLFAKCIENKKRKNPAIVPKKVVSFEHNEEYRQKTQELIRRYGVEDFTDIALAPLVNYDHEGNHFLFYDCDQKMQELNDLIGPEGGRVLVLVDGPPGAAGPLARFPALPKLLKAMPNCRFDIVLDDCNRQEEKNIATKWFDIMNGMKVKYKETIHPMEKWMLFIVIN